jgi:hypothetical protein
LETCVDPGLKPWKLGKSKSRHGIPFLENSVAIMMTVLPDPTPHTIEHGMQNPPTTHHCSIQMLCVPVKITSYLPEIPRFADNLKAVRRIGEGSD